MPSTLIFGCLKLKMRFCEIPFARSIVYSDIGLDKLWQSYKSFFPSKNEHGKLNFESCFRAFPLAGFEVYKTFELLETM